MKLQEIADTLKLSKGFQYYTQTIGYKKVGFRRGAMFKPEQQQQIDDLERCLDIFKQYKPEFLNWCIITMNETWIHHFTPESSQKSAKWEADKSCWK